MEPLLNLAISLGIFALMVALFRFFFVSSTFPGSALPARPGGTAASAEAPKNLVVVESESGFEAAVRRTRVCFVDCTATWCGPCQTIAPVFQALARDTPSATFAKVDIDVNRSTAKRYNVKSIPTFLVLRDGNVVDTMVGADQAKLRQLVAEWARD